MPSGLASAALATGYGSFPARAQLCAPPKGFRSAEGLRSAKVLAVGPFGRSPTPLRGSGAQKAGLRYERKVLDLLGQCFAGFERSPWFEFVDQAGYRRFCQPDGLWRSPDGTKAVIFEVKIRHTSDAYYQLEQLYSPVVQAVYSPKEIAKVILCRSFDPSIPFPEALTQLHEVSPQGVFGAAGIGVYTWKL